MWKLITLTLLIISLATLSAALTNGKTARQGQFKYQVSLQRKLTGDHFCGGSILASNIILTAAHCVIKKSPSEFVVVAGTVNLNAGGIFTNVKNYVVYPFYNRETFDNDVAILYLENYLPIGTNPNVQYIEMIDQNAQLLPGTIVTLSGWGDFQKPNAQTPQPPTPAILQYGQVQVLTDKTCSSLIHVTASNVFCAGSYDRKITSCAGDSGSPLVVGDKLAGVVSLTGGCGDQLPLVSVNLVLFRPWIRKITGI